MLTALIAIGEFFGFLVVLIWFVCSFCLMPLSIKHGFREIQYGVVALQQTIWYQWPILLVASWMFIVGFVYTILSIYLGYLLSNSFIQLISG